MSQNRATIYSNGIAELSRSYSVSKSKPANISIPVRQQHLADVLASLTVSGDVKIDSPPSYQPANVDDGNLNITTRDSLVSIAQQLAGAKVNITRGEETISGQLIGLQDHQTGSAGEPFVETFLIILCKGAIHRVAIKEVTTMQFTDPVIQSEIDKALSRRLREIKPNSTFVDLKLSTDTKKTDATVQYTIPAAAWKISYRLILLENEKVELHGHAIVDNNTDEDWNNFIISVVMGQPITFTSDLADSKTPRRDHVNIVQDTAIGAVEIEEDMEEMVVMAAGGGAADHRFAARAGSKMSKSRSVKAAAPKARIDEATHSESGDFCIFESYHPVSIGARRSASIPVFQTTLGESRTVLHYKRENHQTRPFRSVEFTNSLDHSLGRGVCTVFDQANYAGSCIIPSLKIGQNTLLAHALDTGVKLTPKHKDLISRRMGVRVSEGVVIESHHLQSQTDYHIKNNSKAIPLILDHAFRLGESNMECHLLRNDQDAETIDSKQLENGRRFEISLLEKDELVISVIETKTRTNKVFLVDLDQDQYTRTDWLIENLVESNSPLADDPAVKHCIEIQRRMDEINLQIKHAKAEIDRLNKRQERLRKNIKAGGGQQQDQRWRTDLAKSEDAIVQLEDERLSELQEQLTTTRKQLRDALTALSLQWND